MRSICKVYYSKYVVINCCFCSAFNTRVSLLFFINLFLFYSEVDKMSTTLSEKSSYSFSTGTTTSDDGSDTLLFNKKINEVANSFERTTSDDCSDTLFNNKINEVANAIEREQAALEEDEMIDNHNENEGDEVVDDRVHEEEVVEDDAIAELHRLEAQRARCCWR